MNDNGKIKETKVIEQLVKDTLVYSFPISRGRQLFILTHVVVLFVVLTMVFFYEIPKVELVQGTYNTSESKTKVISEHSGYVDSANFNVGERVLKGQFLFKIYQKRPSVVKSFETNITIENIDRKLKILKDKSKRDKEFIDDLYLKNSQLEENRYNIIKNNDESLSELRNQIKKLNEIKVQMDRTTERFSLIEINRFTTTIWELKKRERELVLENVNLNTKSTEEIATLNSISDLYSRISITEGEISDLLDERAKETNMISTSYFSPSDGVIKNRNVENGDFVNFNDEISTISKANDSNEYVDGYLTPSQASQVKLGEKIQIKFDGYSVFEYGRNYGTIKEITPKNDENNLLVYYYRAKFFPNENKAKKRIPFTDGMQVTTTLTIENRTPISMILDKYTDWVDWQ
ncbi:TPA: HlyD family efflux transporter periplasmic adaptor subunit [Vibrio parahaemolyticus]|nr:HlyD family efflux transporter periplasmic adaptor subunit [Vibrio parahaemolyticus]